MLSQVNERSHLHAVAVPEKTVIGQLCIHTSLRSQSKTIYSIVLCFFYRLGQRCKQGIVQKVYQGTLHVSCMLFSTEETESAQAIRLAGLLLKDSPTFSINFAATIRCSLLQSFAPWRLSNRPRLKAFPALKDYTECLSLPATSLPYKSRWP